jgi:predicted ribosomally synthesized peptide with nif11-like leader
MSTDAVKKFLDLAQADSGLREQVSKVVAERGEESSFELVELAATHGCEFTATELIEYVATRKAGAELSEAELEAVAGGITDIRAILGRQENFFTPNLMSKRKTADPDK